MASKLKQTMKDYRARRLATGSSAPQESLVPTAKPPKAMKTPSQGDVLELKGYLELDFGPEPVTRRVVDMFPGVRLTLFLS